MTTTIDTRQRGTLPATLDEFLVPEARELTPHVGRAVAKAPQRQSRSRKHLARLTHTARLTLAAEIVHELRGALGEDLMDLLVAGLKEHQALREAARSSLTDGVPASVRLARHVVHSGHTVDVTVVSPLFRIDLPFELDLAFDVLEATGQVADGRLCRLTIPDPTVTGTVDVYDKEVYRQEGTLHAGGSLGLGAGVRILSEQEERELLASRPT
jgi:hypothetical protein